MKEKIAENKISSHFIELRNRILKTFLLFVIFSVVGIPFANEIYSIVASPMTGLLPEGMIATEIASPFVAPIKLVLFLALLASMPWLFFQAWMYISPGLYKNEKIFTASLLISTIVLFFGGAAFAFFIVCPLVLNFFNVMAPDGVQVMPDINQYLSFIFKLVFGFGIAFEIPVATILLIRSGIVKKSSLSKARPYLILFFFILGMVLTPPDVISQLFLALPMWILFELGLLLSKDKK